MSKYKIDPLHSEIEFKIKHLMISTVNGRFGAFDAEMVSEKPDFTDAKIWFECDVDSINTGVADRDAHLRTADFFDTAKWPKIKFVSTGIKHKGGPAYDLTGDFTIREVTRPITLGCVFGGSDLDAYGQSKYGFDLTGAIKRSDFGLTFQAYGGAGSAMVGDEVKLLVSVQMTKAA
jgi:polyisoprenoid-binding protein YceI